MVRNIIIIWTLLFFYVSCSTTEKRFLAAGVRQVIYRKKTDLLLTELHYPVTDNTNLDGSLRERILAKYNAFRKQLDDKILDYLNQKTAFIYRATFDVLRSPDLYIISFVLYETWEVQTEGQSSSSNLPPSLNIHSNSANWKDVEQNSNKLTAASRTTQAEVLMYALKFGSVVDFFDVVEQPRLVLENLANSCLRQLNEYIGAGNFYSQGIKPTREHLRMLSVGKQGVQVSFAPGQVMSAAQGVIHILVPWAEAVATKPWQYAIIRRFRPWAYRLRKKEIKHTRIATET